MHKVTPIPVCLADSDNKKVSLSAQVSVDSAVTSEGYRRVRCSAAMIGLAISMSATSIFWPNQSKPAMATGSSSEVTVSNISVLKLESKAPLTQVKLASPALKHQVKQGETLWQLSEDYQVNPRAIAISNNLSLQADLVAGQTLKIPSEELREDNSAQPRLSTEALESSLTNLRETRKRLQESLVALRSEDSTTQSQTQVIVTDVADANLRPERGLRIPAAIIALSPESLNEQSIEIPVEMSNIEGNYPQALPFDDKKQLTPAEPQVIDRGGQRVLHNSAEQISQSTQLNSSTPLNTSTSEENVLSSKKINRQQSEPVPIAAPENLNFSRSPEQKPQLIDISKLETENSTSSSSSPITVPLTPDSSQQITSQITELEQPVAATVVPPLQIPQTQAEQPATKKFYRVRVGDTLNNIARKHGITVAQLIKANNITNPNLIKVNQPLVIPNLVTARKNHSRTTVITGVPVTPSRKSSQLPPVSIKPTHSSSTLVSRLPADVQSQGISDSATGAIEIPVEMAAESHTDKLRADVANLQQQYNNTQPIPIEVKSPNTSLTSSPVAEQPRNSEWDKNRRLSNTRENPQPSKQEQIIGSASVNLEEYNDSLRIPVGETVSPELPGLSNPDHYLPDAPARFNGYIWPTKGVVTSGYGWRWGRMHKGVDIAGPVGTPIVAAAPGEVISAGWNSGGYGNLVKVKHADNSITLYAHNSRILVRRGQQVEQGQLIAEMGSTGYSTGPHLHFELHPNGQKAVNPMAFLPRSRS